MALKIGFIGLGAMGAPMAANLARAGFALNVFDRDPGKMAALEALGAAAASNLGEAVANADVVVTMLPGSKEVESVILGEGGVLAHASSGTTILDMSTISPETTDRVATACRAGGLGFADAPVGRPVEFAVRGQSLFMVGCDDDATFATISPLLAAMGNCTIRCGAAGMGTRMKIVNNFIVLTTAEVVAEAITLGTALGLDVRTMHEVTGATTAQNGQFQTLMVNKVLKGDIEPGFTIDLAFKDLTLAQAAAAEHRIGLPLGAAALAVFGAARSSAYADKDFSALLELACAGAGIKTPRLTGS